MGANARGADLSRWQTGYAFDKVLGWADFVAIKAVESTTYLDPTFHDRWAALGREVAKGSLSGRIAYLFLHPGNGAAQAQYLARTVGKLGPYDRLALDWEASALSSPATLEAAANELTRLTGRRPIVYCSSSQAPRARAYAPRCDYWLADWTPPYPPKWAWTFLQYAGSGLDMDVFDGDRESLDRWFGHKVDPYQYKVYPKIGADPILCRYLAGVANQVRKALIDHPAPHVVVSVCRVGQGQLTHPDQPVAAPGGKAYAISDGANTYGVASPAGAGRIVARFLRDDAVQAVWAARASSG